MGVGVEKMQLSWGVGGKEKKAFCWKVENWIAVLRRVVAGPSGGVFHGSYGMSFLESPLGRQRGQLVVVKSAPANHCN